LRAFDYTDDGELEGKMETGPNLLADCAVVAMGEVVEVECPEEDLEMSKHEHAISESKDLPGPR
jgi:hypothetical protein